MNLMNRRMLIDTEASMLERDHRDFTHDIFEPRCPLCQAEAARRDASCKRLFDPNSREGVGPSSEVDIGG